MFHSIVESECVSDHICSSTPPLIPSLWDAKKSAHPLSLAPLGLEGPDLPHIYLSLEPYG